MFSSLVLFSVFICGSSQGYDWFGPSNRFRCHCTTECDFEGFCLYNGTCLSGWFGLKCQYQNIVNSGSFNPSQFSSLLNDGDNTTCITDYSVESLNVTWDKPYPFTWMRLIFKDDKANSNLKIIFKEDSLSEELICHNQILLWIDANTVDIHCTQPNAIQHLTIDGDFVGSLCELYISGGRNVALKGVAEQKSTYEYREAYFAVDGNLETGFTSCTHTADDDFYPYWKVQLNNSFAVNRYVIFNRDDCGHCRKRLDHFNLSALNYEDQTLFNYYDEDANSQLVYMINDVSNSIISQVNISQRHTGEGSKNPYVTLCEVQIYGDCPKGFWGLDCTNRCDDKCPDSCIADGGWCAIQMNCWGFINPPTCNITCPHTYWGNNCTSLCNIHCLNGLCDAQNGRCIGGCSDGYQLPECTQTCKHGLYGRNCSLSCSSLCTDMKCDVVNGSCFTCLPGFRGSFCEKSCSNKYWGTNCSSPCNSHCLNGLCDAQTGICNTGCEDGYKLPDCMQTCNKYYFGSNCSQMCSNFCSFGTCKFESGECYSCVQGYQGVYCNISYVKDITDEDSWRKYFGIGFVVGVVSLLAVQAILYVIILLRRRRPKRKKSKPQVYSQPDVFSVDNHYYETTGRLEKKDDIQYETVGETSVSV